MRTVVFFHYYEHSKRYRENLVYFLSVAYRRDVEFIVVIADACSVSLPNLSNVRYFRAKNMNNDFGGYASALADLGEEVDAYDYFVFVNSSVRGPFISRRNHSGWIESFIEKMTDDVQLVGSSINILRDTHAAALNFKRRFNYTTPYSHVQTTAYALTRKALKHLLDIGFYNSGERFSKPEVIGRYELRLSQEIKRAGWNMKALLSKYNSIDYRGPHSDINFSSKGGDPLYRGAYFGSTARPHELMFVKTNRDLISNFSLYWHTFKGLILFSDDRIAGWGEYRSLRRVAFFKIILSLIYYLPTFISRACRRLLRFLRSYRDRVRGRRA